MPRFAANLSMLFQEWVFLDRFACAADAGFRAVEFLFPYDHPPEAVGKALADAGLEQALFNLPPGDWAAGERGLAALPGREADFRDALDRALVYAEATGVPRLHAMSGLGDPDDPAARRTYLENLAVAADRLAERGLDVLIEPINRRSVPGYFLCDFRMAESVLETLGRPNLKLQFDVFHPADPAWRHPDRPCRLHRADRPCPDRRRPGPARAGHRRGALRSGVRGAGPARLRRLDRLRIRPRRRHPGRPRLAAVLAGPGGEG